MILVVHIDQLTAERSDEEDVYETWIGTEAFKHDHGRALHIAVQILEQAEKEDIDIRAHLRNAQKLLQSTVHSCIEEIKCLRVEDKSVLPPKLFSLRLLSEFGLGGLFGTDTETLLSS